MIKQHIKRFALLFVIVFLGSLVYVGLLTASLSIAPESLRRNTEQGLRIIESEGRYPSYYFEEDTSQLRENTRIDNYTDDLILRRAGMLSKEPLRDAMYMLDYERYWHGYVVLLRPLLSVMDYYTLRRLLHALFWILAALGMAQLSRRVHPSMGAVLLLALAVLHSQILPMSPQYFVCFGIALSAMNLLLCWEPRRPLSAWRLLLFFALTGSVTSFLDLLTVPLITFALPMLALLLYDRGRERKPLAALIQCAIAWLIGFCFNWILKWFWSTVILGEDEFGWAITQSGIRIGKSQAFPQTQLAALGQNLSALLSVLGILYLLACAALLLLALLRRQHANLPLVGALALLALAPYGWYFALANHSQVHTWFTYRAQLSSLLICFAIPLALADFQLERLLPKRKK